MPDSPVDLSQQYPRSRQVIAPHETSALIRAVYKLSGGLIKQKNQATFVLVVFCLVAILITIWLLATNLTAQSTLEPINDPLRGLYPT